MDGTVFTVTSDPTNGSATINPSSGAWTYTPDEHYNGSDSFTVTVTDDDNHTATQVISLTITAEGNTYSFIEVQFNFLSRGLLCVLFLR